MITTNLKLTLPSYIIIRFLWEIDNDPSAIVEWSPCLGAPTYSSNVSQPITLTAPSTGSSGTTNYILSCISVQYFDQSENGTLGSCEGPENGGSNCTNRADIHIQVVDEKENGSNITVNRKLKIFHFLFISA